MSQRVVVSCSVLQCISVKSTLLALLLAVEGQKLLLHVLQCIVVSCSVLQYVGIKLTSHALRLAFEGRTVLLQLVAA